MPDSLEQLDLLLMQEVRARKVEFSHIQFCVEISFVKETANPDPSIDARNVDWATK
jgi:hypothetical protein